MSVGRINEDERKETLDKIRLLKEKTGLDTSKISRLVMDSWDNIFTITDKHDNFIIGKTVYPKPQIMGFILEVLIAKKFENSNFNEWQFDPTGYSKDITNKKDESLSIEIKTSSSQNRIYGNRSYANPGATSKKSKNSFYLAVNFEKFSQENHNPSITKIRFGYLTHKDWRGQKAASGQQAALPIVTERSKLVDLWPNNDLEIK